MGIDLLNPVHSPQQRPFLPVNHDEPNLLFHVMSSLSFREISQSSSEPQHTGRQIWWVFLFLRCWNHSLVNRMADCSISRRPASWRRVAMIQSGRELLVDTGCQVWAPLSLGNAAQRQTVIVDKSLPLIERMYCTTWPLLESRYQPSWNPLWQRGAFMQTIFRKSRGIALRQQLLTLHQLNNVTSGVAISG